MNNTNLFSTVFKNLFGTSVTPTSSQYVPITSGDGTPAGVSSMANLASVLGVITFKNLPSLGTNKVDWDNIYSSDDYVCFYNDASGNLGYPVSGTAGLLLIIRGYIVVFSYYGNVGIFLGTGYHASVSGLTKIGAI